jgi:transcriptional regulator with XRE-family HTH domain
LTQFKVTVKCIDLDDPMTSDTKNFFCERRRLLGLTQRAIALQLGITVQAVSAWEAGLTNPRPAIWPQVAQVYGVKLEQIAEAVTGHRLTQS